MHFRGLFLSLLSVTLAACSSSALTEEEYASIPPDWRPRVEQSDMAVTNSTPSAGFTPNVGNGHYGVQILGSLPEISWFKHVEPVIFLGGLFNGLYNITPSHRAALPSPVQVVLPEGQFVAGGIDFAHGVFYNRTLVQTPSCFNWVIEQRLYAHANPDMLDLLVVEYQGYRVDDETVKTLPESMSSKALQMGTPSAKCNVTLRWWWDAEYSSDVNVTRKPADTRSTVSTGNDSYDVWSAYTKLPELPGHPARQVIGITPKNLWSVRDETTGSNEHRVPLKFTATGQNTTFPFVYNTDTIDNPLQVSINHWKNYSQQSSHDLLISHFEQVCLL
eukprot:gb/GECG01004881.1/.p1 GENE.gb/GECG01004881.1/~~gb/GECG01004881.1/.p1  ORF type:complete len:332 (+),score=31.70 gb/GECG01004881.1/:1-996(+)